MNWQNLIQNLNSLTEKHRLLLELLEQESDLPSDANLDALDELNAKRKEYLSEIKSLEAARLDILKKDFGDLQTNELKLKNLLQFCEQEDVNRKLTQSREELMSIIGKIQKQNYHNEIMVRGRRHAIANLQNDLNSRLNSVSFYSGKGKTVNTPPSHLMQRWI